MVQCAQADDAVRIIIIDFLLPSSRQLEIWLLPVMEQRSRKKTNTKIKIGLENNLFFTNCRYNRLWYIYRDQSGKEKKYQQDVCMYVWVCRCTRNSSNNSGGEKSWVYIIKWRFLCMNGRFFGNTGITFLGKSEHMRYINFGKFGTLKKQKRFSKIFKRVFHFSKEKEKLLFVGVASYPKLLRTAFLSAC